MNGTKPKPSSRRSLPPSKYQRTISNPQDGSLTIISATAKGVTLGPGSSYGTELSGYKGGVSIFAENLTINSSKDGSPAFTTKGSPLLLSCQNLKTAPIGSKCIIGTRGADGSAGKAKDGVSGGSMNVYVGNMTETSAKAIQFDTQGGKGTNLSAPSKEAGGNGGDGGLLTAIARMNLAKVQSSLLRIKQEFALPVDWEVEQETNAASIYDGHPLLLVITGVLTSFKKSQILSTNEYTEILGPVEKLVQLRMGPEDAHEDESGRPIRSAFRISAAINRAVTSCQKKMMAVRLDLVSKALFKGGLAGKREDVGNDLGERGNDGASGDLVVEMLGPKTPFDISQAPFVFVHPLQAKMVLARADTYFYLDSKDNRAKAQQLLEGLIDRLSFVTPSFIDSLKDGQATAIPLSNAFLQLHGSVDAAQNAAQELQSLLKKAMQLYMQLTTTRVDYFGYPQDWVPRIRYEEHNKMFTDAIQALERAESAYLNYLNEAEAKGKLDSYVAVASARTDDAIRASKEDIAEVNGLLIAKYKSLLDPKTNELILRARNAAQLQLKKLERAISDKFEISPKSFLDGLTNFAGSPEAGPAIGASLVYEGATTVPNLSGEPVSKAVLIRQVKRAGDTASALKSEMLALSNNKDGSFVVDEEQSTKLVTSVQAVEDMIDEFADETFGSAAEDVKAVLKEYSELLMARNTNMVEFNVMLKKVNDAQDDIAKMEAAKVSLQHGRLEQETNTLEDLDSMTKLLEAIVDNCRARVMRILSFLRRSLRYKTLTNVDSIDAAWKDQTATHPDLEEAALSMTSSLLSEMREKLTDQLYKVQEFNSGDKSYFPSEFDKGGIGKMFELPADNLKELLLTRKTQIRIKSVDAIADEAHEEVSEFRGNADIRLYRVRLWLNGLKIKGASAALSPSSEPRKSHSSKVFGGGKQVTAKITHTGSEVVVDSSNNKLHFQHDPIAVTFSYRLYPDGTYEVDDATGGDIVNFSSKSREENSVYAAPSPFTTWTISLADLNDKELDVSGVTAASLEFYGSYRSFRD